MDTYDLDRAEKLIAIRAKVWLQAWLTASKAFTPFKHNYRHVTNVADECLTEYERRFFSESDLALLRDYNHDR